MKKKCLEKHENNHYRDQTAITHDLNNPLNISFEIFSQACLSDFEKKKGYKILKVLA